MLEITIRNKKTKKESSIATIDLKEVSLETNGSIGLKSEDGNWRYLHQDDYILIGVKLIEE